jgi:hypothetical protein
MLLQEMDTAKDVPPLIRWGSHCVSAFSQKQNLSNCQLADSTLAIDIELKKAPA